MILEIIGFVLVWFFGLFLLGGGFDEINKGF